MTDWGTPEPGTAAEEAQIRAVFDAHRRELIRDLVTRTVAERFPALLDRHGITGCDGSNLVELQASIVRSRCATGLRRAGLPSKRQAQGFRAEDRSAIRGHATRLLGYATGSTAPPRNPATPASVRRKIVVLFTLPRIVRVAAAGLPSIADIVHRISEGEESPDDLRALILGLDRIDMDPMVARGRPDAGHDSLISAALAVWHTSGSEHAPRLVGFLCDVLQLAGWVIDSDGPQREAVEVRIRHSLRKLRDRAD